MGTLSIGDQLEVSYTRTLTLPTHGHQPSLARSPPMMKGAGAALMTAERRPQSAEANKTTEYIADK